MRLLVLAPQEFYVDRGTPIAVDLLVRTLAEQGHEVEVLAFHRGATPAYPNVTVHRIPAVPFVRAVGPGLSARKLLCDALFAPAALRLLASGRFDVVHAVEEAVFVAMAAQWLFGLPYVYDMDSSMSDQVLAKARLLRPAAPLMRALERAAVRRSAAVAPVCDALAARAVAAGARRVVLLGDVSLLAGEGGAARRAAVRHEVAGEGPATVAMYVGNLERYQGIDLLLDAFARAARREPSLVLVLIGGAPADVARYGRAAAAAGLGGRVRLLGPRPVSRLGEYLAAADLLVSPRVAGDNTPMKVYSYLHAGRPVVATDLPTHTQVLTPEVALLVPPDPEWLAGALVRLARDPALRARLGAAGRRLAEARYSRDAFAAQVAALYPPAGFCQATRAERVAAVNQRCRTTPITLPAGSSWTDRSASVAIVPGGAGRAPGPAPDVDGPVWAERLFARSVLKRQKLREIVGLLGDTRDLDCLDLGSDNGVVSLLLRRRGGRWQSADLDPLAVASIRELVRTGVHQLDGPRLPFPDDRFDVVVVVDLLEHVQDDRALVADIRRVTRPGGRLIVNVPHARDTALRRVRLALGQTDEKHGHVRHGYTPATLGALLEDRYEVLRWHTYSRFFSEAVDAAVTAGYGLVGRGRTGSKGVVVTGADLARHARLFRLYSALYPLFWCAVQLDRAIGFADGYMLIAEARSTKAARAAKTPATPPGPPAGPPAPARPA